MSADVCAGKSGYVCHCFASRAQLFCLFYGERNITQFPNGSNTSFLMMFNCLSFRSVGHSPLAASVKARSLRSSAAFVAFDLVVQGLLSSLLVACWGRRKMSDHCVRFCGTRVCTHSFFSRVTESAVCRLSTDLRASTHANAVGPSGCHGSPNVKSGPASLRSPVRLPVS